MNSMVVRGREPIVVDTGCPIHCDQYLDDLFAFVEADDVHWVFVSHDDVDHDGNLHQVIDACPNATLVANWFLRERSLLEVSPLRWRWVGDGESFDAGDRTMLAVTATVARLDNHPGPVRHDDGVYWASDCYSTPVRKGTAFVDQLPCGRRDPTRSSTGSARGSPSLIAITTERPDHHRRRHAPSVRTAARRAHPFPDPTKPSSIRSTRR